MADQPRDSATLSIGCLGFTVQGPHTPKPGSPERKQISVRSGRSWRANLKNRWCPGLMP